MTAVCVSYFSTVVLHQGYVLSSFGDTVWVLRQPQCKE